MPKFQPASPTVPLADIFQSDIGSTASTITLANLATTLGVLPSRLFPLCAEGYLVPLTDPPLTQQTLVPTPSAAAISWMRGWFQSAQAKPLFSREDLAALLDCPVKEVLGLAQQYGVPVVRDEALGWLFSTFAAHKLLFHVLGGREVTRYDRIALLHWLLEGDPGKVLAAPQYSDAMEQELARAAKLDEPARSIRTQHLLEAMQDAEQLAESVKKS